MLLSNNYIVTSQRLQGVNDKTLVFALDFFTVLLMNNTENTIKVQKQTLRAPKIKEINYSYIILTRLLITEP